MHCGPHTVLAVLAGRFLTVCAVRAAWLIHLPARREALYAYLASVGPGHADHARAVADLLKALFALGRLEDALLLQRESLGLVAGTKARL